jgi:bifunctional UDP-N-acetylglucosamine pyrophosphorylase / glucosamine-1-phosphate N-acetyltransferase
MNDTADRERRVVSAAQFVKPGWADRFHEAMRKRKADGKK